MSASLTTSRTTQPSAQVGGSDWVARLGRAGFTARGIVYLLIAYLAAKVAGGGGRQVDRDGALRTVMQHPFGRLVVALLAAGFGAYALWLAACAAFGLAARGGDNRSRKRLASAAMAVFYAFLCVSTAALAAGHQRSASGGNKPEVEWTARVMRHGFGRYAVGLAGAVLIVGGLVMAYRAVTGHRDPELHPPLSIRPWVERLAAVGLSARALVTAAIGVFLVEAAASFDPAKAKGLDGALKSFAHTPLGPWLLFAVAAGLLAFGLYSLAEGAWADL